MIRGIKRVKCTHCGHTFLAPDIEDNATVAGMPVLCPRCGAEIKTDGILGLLSRLIDSIF